jgi:hypothetical protein
MAIKKNQLLCTHLAKKIKKILQPQNLFEFCPLYEDLPIQMDHTLVLWNDEWFYEIHR